MIVIAPICCALNGEQKEKLIEPFSNKELFLAISLITIPSIEKVEGILGII
jgi:hypothetical protein